jgi:hypothetical protein
MDNHNKAFLNNLNLDLQYHDKKQVNPNRPLCIDCFHNKREIMYEDLSSPIFFTVRDKIREMVRRRLLTKYETRFKNYMEKL